MTIDYAGRTGAERWVVRDRHLATNLGVGSEVGDWLGITRDGRALVVAGSVGRSRHGATAHDTSDGDTLWTLETSRSISSCPSIVPTPTSDVVFLADENRGDYLVVAIDATMGRELWRSTYDGVCDDDIPIGIAVSPDASRVYVTGTSSRPGGHICPQVATIVLDAADGQRRSTATLADPAEGIAVGGDGGIYLVDSREAFLLIRLDRGVPRAV